MTHKKDTLKKVTLLWVICVLIKIRVKERIDMGKLKRVVFTEEQMEMLETNPNVLRVTESAITYTPAFKLAAIQASSLHTRPDAFRDLYSGWL